MSKYTFDLKHTNIIKGFLVLVLLFHHVFHSDMDYWINLARGGVTPTLLTQIAAYGKMCIGGFCFLSAYGITKKMMNKDADVKNIVVSRLVKLYFGFLPVYFIGVIGSLFFGNYSLQEIYTSSVTGKFSWIYPVLDTLGISYFFGAPQLNKQWWYISAAMYIIFLTPLFNYLYSKFKYIVIVAICIIPYIINIDSLVLIPTIAIGILFAREDLFVRIKEKINYSIGRRIIGYFFIIFYIYFTFELVSISTVSHAMPFSTLACLLFCYIILAEIPVLSHMLAFLGKHSANIYYIHAFIYLYWFPYTIYSFGSKVLIYLIVLISSLLISVVLELCKKFIRYKKLEQKVITRLTFCANK